VVLLELDCPGAALDLLVATAGLLGEPPRVAIAAGLRQTLGKRVHRLDDRARLVDCAASSAPVDLAAGSLRPRGAWAALDDLGGRAVLLVRAGRETEATLRMVAADLAHSSIEVLALFVVDPDPRDQTDGAGYDAFHDLMHRHQSWLHTVDTPAAADQPS
jgi:hypothetical protein